MFAEDTHSEFLRQLALSSDLKVEDIVFHGGTSLRIIYDSPRYSEDLDFMVSQNGLKLMQNIIPSVAKTVSASLKMTYPEVDVAWKAKRDKQSGMMVGFLKVDSPLWHQSVKVKVECYPALDMSSYPATQMDIDSQSGISVPTATLDAIMADKIVNMAMRPYFKERDAYDVWWLIKQGVKPNLIHIDKSCAVYGYDTKEVLERLEDLDDRMGSATKLGKDLKRWLPPELHKHFAQHDVFKEIRETCLDVGKKSMLLPSDGMGM